MDLEECNQITDLTLAHLATGCPSLEKLVSEFVAWTVHIIYENDGNLLIRYAFYVFQTLSHCELITDDGIRQLTAGSCAAESLSVLELDNCPLITDQTLEHLVSCHNLQQIELYDCQMITRAAIRRLRVGQTIQFHSHLYMSRPFPDKDWSNHYFVVFSIAFVDRIIYQISKCTHILHQSHHHQQHPVPGHATVAAVRFSERRPLA